MKPTVAIVRGKFLNRYEMQFFEPLVSSFDITAFGSTAPFHDSFAFPTQKLFCPMDIPEFPYKMSLLNRMFVDAHYLVGLEKELAGFDLVHSAETYYHYTQQALNAKKKGVVKKVIATVLENIPFNNEGIHGRKEFKQRARNELDHIIALTERTKATLLLEGCDEKKITVISHFVDTQRFKPAVQKNSGDRIHILFCGRLEIYKGIYEIVYAARLLSIDAEMRNKQILFTFVGDGTQKKQLQTKITELGLDHMIQFRSVPYDSMPDMYAQADIYVAPSKSSGTWIEQYNTTLLEAQASGLPIVTTYSGGIPENVGEAAVLIPPEDSYALFMELKQLILDPNKREQYGQKARKRAEAVHDIKRGAEKISALYQTVLNE